MGPQAVATSRGHFGLLGMGGFVWIGLAAILVLLIANPLAHLLSISFSGPNGVGWTLANYEAAFGSRRYLQAYGNSLLLGVCVAGLCVVFGVPIAWAVSRTDMPFKGVVRVLVLATFVTPPFLGATAWILLASPNAGWINVAFRSLFGSGWAPFNIYSFAGVAFVLAIYSFPYVFTFTTAALENVSSEMEDAAGILGSGRWRTMRRITLPMVLPAILAASIITYLDAISIISSTIMVALPARINLIPLQLWEFFSYPLRVEVAAAYSVPMVLVAVAMFWAQKRLLGRKGYVALTGKGGQRRPIELGPIRWVMLGWCMFVLGLSIVAPYLVLLEGAFTRAWTRGLARSNVSLENFAYLFSGFNEAPRAILNTFSYSGLAASFAVLLSLAIAYITTRRLLPGSGALAALAYTPVVIPGLVLAIGFYATYAVPPFQLAGTGTLLVIAFTTRFLPISFASSSSAMSSINPEMEEAARILGGTRVLALRRILAPLLKRNLAGAWLLVFILSSREVSSALFLYGPKSRTMSVYFFDLAENGRFEILCALGVVLLVTTLVFVLIGQAFVGRDFMVRRDA
jgi:iron(III) transport system permease protein